MSFSERTVKVANTARWLMLLFTIVLLEFSGYAWFKQYTLLFPILILLVYNISVRFLPKKVSLFRVAYAESTLDVVFVTAIIWSTGKMESPFFLLYFLPIIFASCYYETKATLLLTFGISLLYTWLFFSSEADWISSLLVRVPLFFGIAGLSSYITREVRLAEAEVEYERERASELLAEMQKRLEKVKEENARLAQFYNISIGLETMGDLRSQLKKVIETVALYLKTETNLIGVVSANTGILEIVAGDDVVKREPKTKGLIDKALVEGETVLANSTEKREFSPYADIGITSLILIPLKIKKDVIGVLLSCSTSGKEFTENDQKFLRIVANISSLLIENDRLSSEIERLSVTDKLTALFNYYYFEEALRKEIERAKRLDQRFAVLCAKIDVKKPEPSSLQKTGLIINYQTRRDDLVATKDGIFYLLAHKAGQKEAQRLAERIKGSVEKEIGESISMGVAAFSPDILTQKELLEKAERALAEASKEGNMIVISE
jgi:diguanylate cyclase (GGDEF)-like protein